MAGEGVRASDDEREATVRQLKRAVTGGRLSTSEFEERVEAAYLASTRGDLAELTRDLPASLW